MQKKTGISWGNLLGYSLFLWFFVLVCCFVLMYYFPGPVSAKPVQVYGKLLQGASLKVVQIDLSDPATQLDIVLANQAPQANNSEKSYGDEPFGAMVRRSKSAALINGTFFSKDAQKRVMGNMVSGGRFLKYSPWENFGTTLAPTARPTAVPTPSPAATSGLVSSKITPLTAPKYFFWYVYRKDYPKAWELLSEKSKAVIVYEIALAVNDPGNYSEPAIRRAMDNYQTPFAETFWGAFRQNLEIETWVKQNFTLLESGTEQALVRVAPIGIDLRILFEDGLWRLGYAETFFQGN